MPAVSQDRVLTFFLTNPSPTPKLKLCERFSPEPPVVSQPRRHYSCWRLIESAPEEALVERALSGGCSSGRRTAAGVSCSGFTPECAGDGILHRSRTPAQQPAPVQVWIVGVASGGLSIRGTQGSSEAGGPVCELRHLVSSPRTQHRRHRPRSLGAAPRKLGKPIVGFKQSATEAN